MRTLSALGHDVNHYRGCCDPFEDYDLRQWRHLSVGICGVFHEINAHGVASTLNHERYRRVLKNTVAKYLATVPVALPDLSEVLDEVSGLH